MTPGARISAMIEVLESILVGVPTEKALTNWGRGNRFAGSKDRAAIRDLVFQAVRCRRSAGAWPKPISARAWAIGSLQANDVELENLFNNIGHAPKPLTNDELTPFKSTDQDTFDLQDWIIEELCNSYGIKNASKIAEALRHRAPICLRVNTQKATQIEVQKALANNMIDTIVNPVCETALTVTTNFRRVVLHDIYKKGWFELQDAASQAVATLIPGKGKVLDFCAGGGGKSLAVSARTGGVVFAHDADPKRMSEIEVRTLRGGHDINIILPDQIDDTVQFDSVFCDIPCSGSGAWRRSPEEKWKLTQAKILKYQKLQRQILIKAESLVKLGGTFSMITCSIFTSENQEQRDFLLKKFKNLTVMTEAQYFPTKNNDGLYIVVFRKSSNQLN
jgi:16S rRNA (cytosine967-C5)-methyltransferase